MNNLTLMSLFSLAFSVLTSMTLGALSHLFIIIPIVYEYVKNPKPELSKSQKSLLLLIIVMMMSIVINHEIMAKGFSELLKLKYYLIGVLAVAPIQKMFNSLKKEKRDKVIKLLIHILLVTASVASIYGVLRLKFDFNPLGLKYSDAHRNTGFFGMVLNYAHNLAFVLVFTCSLVFNSKKLKKYVDIRFLIFVLIINLCGIYFAFSRGAILAFFAGLPFLVFFRHVKLFAAFSFGAFLIAAFFLLHPSVKIERLDSDGERLAQWKTAIVAFKEKPVLGYGYLNFEHRCKDIKERNNIEEKHYCGHAHNIFLEILASTGFLGFLLMIVWLFFWVYETIKRNDLVAEIVLPLIVVFVVGGLTQATFTLGANLFLIMGVYTLSQVRVD